MTQLVQDSVKKFISDSQVLVLYIQRSSIKDEDSDQNEAADDVIYDLSNDVHYTPKITSVVIVKRGTVIEADKPVMSQVGDIMSNILQEFLLSHFVTVNVK